jgi:hypothetical protein
MMQTRTQSAIEATANVLVGYLVALASQVAIFPLFGIQVPLSTNLAIGAWFTVISLVRSYVLRRWFNGLKFRRATLEATPEQAKEAA